MDTRKSAEVLNTLIKINTVRLHKYEKASLQTDETDLQELFYNFQEKSQYWIDELISEIKILGQKPLVEKVSAIQQIILFWFKLKSKFMIKDREELLNNCEYFEELTIKKYKDILNTNLSYLTDNHKNIVTKQVHSIKSDHDLLKDLGELLVTYRQFNLDI